MDRAESDALVHDSDAGIERLVEIMRRLRAREDGCPWDLKQTFATIAPYTVEEAYEVADAIDRGHRSDLKDELGDLLFQIVYHAQMAAEEKAFYFQDVVRANAEKMVRRHPHVFGDGDVESWDWEGIKAEERAAAGKTRRGVLDDIPLALPALARAEKLQSRAAKVGFDWLDTDQVIAKISEEAAELQHARDNGADPDHLEDELGDLLFVVANLARHLKIDPEKALRRTNGKFKRRFEYIERSLAAADRTPDQSSLAEMDALWNEAKYAERTKIERPGDG